MSDWKPNLYLEFGKERTQPSIDLVARIDHNGPQRMIDIGCGPGNSTNVLKARWPQAEIIGLDNSKPMIDEAKSKYLTMEWICADASDDLTHLGKFDIVFSNAAIQWMPRQEQLLPNLFHSLNKGGVLAVQVPYITQMPLQIELMNLVLTDKWKSRFADMASTYTSHPPDFYYDLLCNLTPEFDVWETRYFHVMFTHADMVKWFSGTGLRTYLDCLTNSMKAEFCKEYEDALKKVYPVQADGKILFPFTRIFFTATKI